MTNWSEISEFVFKTFEKNCDKIVIVDTNGPTVFYDKKYDNDNHVLEKTPSGFFVRNDYFSHFQKDECTK